MTEQQITKLAKMRIKKRKRIAVRDNLKKALVCLILLAIAIAILIPLAFHAVAIREEQPMGNEAPLITGLLCIPFGLCALLGLVTFVFTIVFVIQEKVATLPQLYMVLIIVHRSGRCAVIVTRDSLSLGSAEH